MSVTKGEMRSVTIPAPDKEWHPIATRLYRSLKTSGMADFYQNSDWAYAWSLCDDLSDYKKSHRRSAQMAQVIYSAMTNLGATEADRRRMRIELHEPEDASTDAEVVAIADYQAELGVVPN